MSYSQCKLLKGGLSRFRGVGFEGLRVKGI